MVHDAGFPARFVDDSLGFQLVLQVDPHVFGRSDFFSAEFGRQSVDRFEIRNQCAAGLATVDMSAGKLRQGPVSLLLKNLVQFITLHVRHPSSSFAIFNSMSPGLNRFPPFLSWRLGAPVAPGHAMFPVRVLATASAPCAVAIWSFRSSNP